MQIEEIVHRDKYVEVRYDPLFELKFNDWSYKNFNGRTSMNPDVTLQMDTHLFTFRYKKVRNKYSQPLVQGIPDVSYELHTTDFNLPILEAYLAKYEVADLEYVVRCMFTSMYPNFVDEAGNHYNIPTKFIVDVSDNSGRLRKIFSLTKPE